MTNPAWSAASKIGFRFSFLFILAFIAVMNNGAFPFFHYISLPIVRLLQQFTPWFAENILQYSYNNKVTITGSGDTSFAWVTLLILCLSAMLGAIIWSILDKKRKNYQTAYYWLTTIIRYYIAFMLIKYGAVKLVHAQMPPPGLGRLMQPLGEFSPMGLAWTFLGFSKGYSIFMGVAEVLSGLLLFRKTMVLGALITLATSVNIMAINYFFDVPVKMLSSALFLFSLFLLIPYIKPLFQVLIAEKRARIRTIVKPKFDKRWKNSAMVLGKIALIGLVVVPQFNMLIDSGYHERAYGPKSPLYGIYRITSNPKTGKIIPNDWAFIIFEYGQLATVRDTYYQRWNESITVDTIARQIKLNRYTLDYTVRKNGDVILTKVFEDRVEEIKLIKQAPETFELMKRKFNWIQEFPYNR